MMSSTLSDSELLRPKQIGTFLRNTAIDAHQYGFDENVHSISENLKKLMTNHKVDLLLMTNFFLMNDFLNLELYEDFEIENEFFDLNQFIKCSQSLLKLAKKSKYDTDDLHRPKKNVYQNPTPCLNVSQYPFCHGYCQWHKEILDNMIPKENNVIIR